MTAMRRLKIQPVLSGIAVLVSTAMAAVLIPSLGLKGAVLTLGTVTILQGAATLGVIAQGWSRFPSVPDTLATREA
jgi:hypothetical protein